MRSTRFTAFLAALTTWAITVAAQAQEVFVSDDLPRGDWMTSGLAPLVLLLGLGILVALVAAAIAAATMLPRGGRRRFRGGPTEA